MKKILYSLMIIFPALSALGQPKNDTNEKPLVTSAIYRWQHPVQPPLNNISQFKLFEGRGFDMEYVSMHAFTIDPSKDKTEFQVPYDEEHLMIVKSGILEISFKNSTWSLGKASIALLMPGEKYSLLNRQEPSGEYYIMKYRSKQPVNTARGRQSGGSFVKDWDKLIFHPNARGGTRKYFEKGTAMSRRFEMHVTTLNEGLQSHDPHTHAAEEIVLIIDNRAEMQIGDRCFKGKPGDVYYVGSNVPHGIRNDGTGPCTYFAYQFE